MLGLLKNDFKEVVLSSGEPQSHSPLPNVLVQLLIPKPSVICPVSPESHPICGLTHPHFDTEGAWGLKAEDPH